MVDFDVGGIVMNKAQRKDVKKIPKWSEGACESKSKRLSIRPEKFEDCVTNWQKLFTSDRSNNHN